MNKFKNLLTLLLFTGLVSTSAMAGGCPEDILTPDDKDTRVKYIDKHFKLRKFKCIERGGPQYWNLPKVSGKECAKTRVDGCNFGRGSFVFASRDRDLITPSCNAHDLCYSTFGLSKEQCDNEFATNLQKTVDHWDGTYSIRIPYTTVIKDGNTSNYDAAQAWAKERCK